MQGRSQEEPSSEGQPIDSLKWWRWAHAEQLRLCAELEQIADSLPRNISRQKCIYAAKALAPVIKGVHHYEDTVLFPHLEKAFSSRTDMTTLLARLKLEHFEDECLADELEERLIQLGAGRTDVNMEATGYMLRGFFEAIRRHVAVEEIYLSAFSGESKTPGDGEGELR
jgi:hemerythrin-like domain-containing protein